MRSPARVVSLLLVAAACRDVTVPPPAETRPGTLRATLVTALPGRLDLVPAEGAVMQLTGTSLREEADAEGAVLLDGLATSSGRVLVTFDADGDGVPDRSRAFDLAQLRAGPGRDVSLGTVVLGRNATLSGSVLRGDLAESPSAHFGIAVFVPEGPQLAYSSGAGQYVLGSLPEGPLTVTFFADGYAPETLSLEARPAEELRIAPLTLERVPGAPAQVTLGGQVVQAGGAGLEGVNVKIARRGVTHETSTGADGRFAFAALPPGVYSLSGIKAGFESLRVDNVLVAQPDTQVGPYTMTAGESLPVDLDGGSLGPPDAGAPPDAGELPDSGSPTDGGADAGTDGGTMGPLPIAFASGPQFALPGAMVTLDGSASTGDHPLTYTWTVLPPNGGLALAPNGTITAWSPRFTAPPLGNIVEVSLVVTDRFGRMSSNSSVARIPIAGPPTARFLPDAGAFLGSESITLTSTSFDDAGLLLIGYAWAQTPPVAGATLVADGGSAVLTFPPVVAGNPIVVGVELSVTNSVGISSTPARRTYVANPGAAGNWTLGATLSTPTPILFDGMNPPVQLLPQLATGVAAPQVTYAWSCPGLGSALTVLDGGVAEFAVPVVEGPDRIITCQVTATAQPPLDPPSRVAMVGFTLRDDKLPVLLSSRPSPAEPRVSPFGAYLKASEPFGLGTQLGGCTPATIERTGSAVLMMTGFLQAGMCSAWSAPLIDFATPANTTPSVSISPAFSTAARWDGPYVSQALYDDPRPVVVTAGQLPIETQALDAPPSSPPLPFELVGRQGTSLVTFGVDLRSPPSPCSPECTVSGTLTALPGLDPMLPAPTEVRAMHAGAELFVAMQKTDAGVPDTLYARRSTAGVWSPMPVSGELYAAADGVHRVRLVGGAVVSDVFDRATSTFVQPETVTVPSGPVAVLTGGEARFQARTPLVYVQLQSGAISVFHRVAASATWLAPITFPTTLMPLRGRPFEETCCGLRGIVVVTRPTAPHFLGNDGSMRPINSLGPVTGFDLAQRFQYQAFVVAQNGDVRLYFGSVDAPTAIVGPPRAVPLAPGDNRLDLDPSCEADHPRLAFIEDALVVTWQERCAPETRYRIVTRIIR